MKLRCYLREHRGRRSIRDIATAAGIEKNAGMLSRIEQGRMLPPDSVVAVLEEAYGVKVTEWYPPAVLLVLELDDERSS
jgi:ribosome-binding protein aMBF1 (putative translation factor)